MRRIVVLGVAVTVLLPVGSTASQAAFRGTPGDIVFSSDRTGNSQIWVRHANGSETNLSSSASQDRDPAWSPAGTRVAYTHGSNVWVMYPNGTHQTNLTRSRHSNGGPAWSPDGTKIAFVSDRDVTSEEIYVMDADGSNVHRLTTNTLTEHDLAWSPNGRKIAFDAYNGSSYDIYTVRATNGSGLTDLTNNAATDENPDWSPDGTKIAFDSSRTAGSNLYVMNADGSGQAAVGTPNVYAAAVNPAWSPDGTALTYAANWGLGSLQLWTVAANGSNYGATGTKLTQDSGVNNQPDQRPVHAVTLTTQPTSGRAGKAITISGGGFLAGDKVKLVFRDAKGVTKTLGTVAASSSGAITMPTSVPSRAAAGKALVTATAGSFLTKKVAFTVTR